MGAFEALLWRDGILICVLFPRLHSPEARLRMNGYVIGKIEGRWNNFLPPIQGGKFRRRDEEEEEEEVVVKPIILEPASSSGSSQEPSPIFDPVDYRTSSFRQRKGNSSEMSRVSSATSISSVGLDEPKSHLSHLDVKTQEEIDLDKAAYPPLDAITQDEIVRKYRLLNERIKAEGLYQCNYWAYAPEVARYSLLFVASMFFLRRGWYVVSAFFLGLFWHQLVFSAHDAGHMGITHNFTVDTIIGTIIADFLGGLSLGWWKRNHNVHHVVTNSPEHDPDIQHMPMFAVSHRFLESLRSTYYDRIMAYDAAAKVMIRAQSWLYYPILTLGRFNLYRLSWEYLLTGQAPTKGPAWWTLWFELAGQIFFWYWFGYLLMYKSIPDGWSRFIFFMISHIVTTPVHVQITLSHFAMSTADLGVDESFPQKMLRTTMDVDCPQWLDFIHGGLQFQVIHHLYPRIPRHNLRRTQKLVQEFCDEVGIPYALYGFVDGNKVVIGRLEEVARQAKIMAECQRTVAMSEGFGMH
jgi:sphingolipid 8-(E)-desaturase